MTLLNTKNVAEHFGLPLTADFIINTLKVPEHSGEKRAKFWEPSALPKIGEALAKYAVMRGAAKPDSKPAAAPKPAADTPAADDDNSDLF